MSIKLQTADLKKLRTVDKRLVSYNVEMTEVTGGTFWKAYTPEQIAGTEQFGLSNDFVEFTLTEELMQYFPPIDLYDGKLLRLAKALGSVWVRVSGTWATKTYYDFDGTMGGKAPEGYASVLTREQWVSLLDFVKAVDGKLLISVSNCAGDHPNGGALDLTQTKKIFDFSHEYGVDIDAAEFFNEPNMLEASGAPKGYTAADFVRDQDIFNGWVREHYPNCLIVGPCACKSRRASVEALMDDAKVPLDIFSCHYYNGASDRMAPRFPREHWDPKLAHTDEYLAVASEYAKYYAAYRDKYVPNGQMWVTESGDAWGGGNTWGSTYLDVFRTLNELGSFAKITDGIIFQNTLASSDYGFLEHGTFEPRPNYFAVWLWNQLMGDVVYETESRENLHIYCHSRKDGKNGCTYLIINNSLTDTVTFELPKTADIYSLSGDTLRAEKMKLNGVTMDMENMDKLTTQTAEKELSLAPATCTFVVL